MGRRPDSQAPLWLEDRPGMWARRALSIPGLLAITAIYLALSPLLVVLAAAVDLARGGRRWLSLRCLLALGFNLIMHVLALLALTALGFLGARGSSYFKLEIWWAKTMLAAAMRQFDMSLQIDGEEALTSSPVIVFSRHVSILDAMLPVIIAGRHRIRLRAVMKRELLWDPCVDIIGHHIRSAFVRRYTRDHAPEVAAVGRLLEHLGPEDGVLMFPEGTRASDEKRAGILRTLERKHSPHLDRARSLRHVLPPRLGGTLEILRSNPGYDIVFCAHTGLEGFNHLKDLFRGTLLGASIQVRLWRVPFAELPGNDHERLDWLFDAWQQVDDWIDTHRASASAVYYRQVSSKELRSV